MKIREAYEESLRREGHVEDPAQLDVITRFEELQARIAAQRPRKGGLRTMFFRSEPRETLPGLYIWGGVGRGKTFLMDLFFESLDIEEKKRIHFHRMMHDVHERMKTLSFVENPLDKIAASIARQTRVLCFDEFFVSDIGDAMILGGLLQGLFKRGVTLVTTSNSKPDDLYKDGLQRQRFLPAIKLLNEHTNVVNMDGGTDYRRCAKGVAWFRFSDICDGPRSQADYIEIARWYPSVIISGVPQFDAAKDDQARRFISLVDEFYDRRVKLILSADVGVQALYQGSRLAYAFERTISRLIEMQSNEYLALPHFA